LDGSEHVVVLQVCKVQMHSSGVSGVEGQPMGVVSASRVIRSEVITVAAVQERFRNMESPAKEVAAAAYKYRVQVQACIDPKHALRGLSGFLCNR
jgi:hypothetical protein